MMDPPLETRHALAFNTSSALPKMPLPLPDTGQEPVDQPSDTEPPEGAPIDVGAPSGANCGQVTELPPPR